MRLPDTVIFDLDGTLVDSAPDLTGALNHTMRTIGLPEIGAGDVRHMVGHGARALIQKAVTAAGTTIDDAAFDAAFDTFLDYYADHVADLTTPFPNVLGTLSFLRDQGVKLGVCTNKPQRLADLLLEALGMEHWFGAIVGADAVEHRKPHAGHLTATVDRLGGDLRRAVMVGDSQTDVDTARNAGTPVVAVSFGYSTVPAADLMADRLIDDFIQLPEALAALIAHK
ncbi:phosphoglycolate phosphatase [Emcibacter sp. SYSU 3D8]|uniref:phosphoglycolate phosphatase n=1 Tax=Emcibacter sp. SYSU 3D8 TaxID=3133969 RepID=UPI0031FEF3C6